MTTKKDEITLRQLILIFFLIVGSPAIRLIPSYTAKAAKQASWITPIVAAVVLLIIFLVFQVLFDTFKKQSFLDIMQIVLGKFLGKTLSIAYLIWVGILVALYTRYYAERIVSSIFPNVNYVLFSGILILIIAFVLRSGLAVFARMAEIFLPAVVLIFLVLNFFISSEVKWNNLYPITYKDTIPVLQGSLGCITILGYITYLFILSDKVTGKDMVKKFGIGTVLSITPLMCMVIIAPVGVFGWGVVSKMNLAYFAAVKDISLFGIIERVESSIIAVWVLSDFAIITAFAFVCLHIIGWLFKSPTEKPFINIFLVLVFILTMYIASNSTELRGFSDALLMVSITLCIIVPILVFIVGKIRKLI